MSKLQFISEDQIKESSRYVTMILGTRNIIAQSHSMAEVVQLTKDYGYTANDFAVVFIPRKKQQVYLFSVYCSC